MCGIVVGMSFGKLDEEKEAQRQAVLKILTTELLIQTEERGKDAVGAGLLFDDGRYFGIKRGDRAGEFLSKFATSKEYFGGLLKVWDQHKDPCRVYLGHCRKGTGGDKTDNANNHPIKIKNLVGIHNGMLRNDDEIFEKLGCKRDGQVDSEAIFRLLDYCTNHGAEPFTNEMLIEVANRLDGEYAITLFNADNREQVPFIRYKRPVEFILLKELGIVLAISELKFWSNVHFKYERIANYYGDMLKLDLPNFLNPNMIDKKAMTDDTVGIFDLTKEVTGKTKIEDLFEDKRIIGAKKWKAAYTSSAYNRSGATNLYGGQDWRKRNQTGYTGGTGSTNVTAAKKDENNAVKARIFNKITRKYEVKEGDKVISDSKSIALAVGSSDTSTFTSSGNDKDVNTVGLFDPDNATEKKPLSESPEIEIEDLTTYKPDPQASRTNDDDGDDIHFEGEAPDTIDANFRVIREVDMEEEDKIPPEIMDKAQSAYNKLPTEERGYTDINDIIDSITVQDEASLRRLGPKFLANRVAHHSWVKGYAAALMSEELREENTTTVSKNEEKDRRRENYIFGLKRMIMMMVYAVQNSKEEGSHDLFQSHISGQLAQIALNSPDEFDVEVITGLFTDYERGKLKDVIDVIQNAEDYKNAGSPNND